MFGSWSMTVLTIAAVLAFCAISGVLAYHTRAALQSIRSGIALEAFFDPSMRSEDAQAIVHERIEKISGVTSSSFTSKEQALEDYKRASGEDVESVLGLNPLPASVSVRTNDPSSGNMHALESVLRATPGISEVRADLELLRAMESRASTLDILFLVLGITLLLTAIFYVVTYTGYAALVQREALRAMKHLGATRSQLTLPLAFEAAFAGFVGGWVAVMLLIASSKFGSRFLPTELHLLRGHTEYLIASLSVLAAGTLVSGVIAYVSASWRLRSI